MKVALPYYSTWAIYFNPTKICYIAFSGYCGKKTLKLQY